MRTQLSPAQLADPHIAAAEANMRTCVHCGICTATCPTYVLTGDERDGPRGRIVMIQRMLESNAPPTDETVHHIDRCLTCLGCRTACPSSVNYARLIDTAREYIHTRYRRAWQDRLLRAMIAYVMPRPALLKVAMGLARLTAPISTRMPGALGAMAKKAMSSPWPLSEPTNRDARGTEVATRARAKPGQGENGRVALMPGCVQHAMAPTIDRAAKRVLARRGMLVEPLDGAGCCGALAHHLGRHDEAKAWARRAIFAFEKAGMPDGVLITATGCAAHLADYPHLFADEPAWRARAEIFAARVKDFSELAVVTPAQRGVAAEPLRIAFHTPCSLQHGLRRAGLGERALEAAGFEVLDIPEGHLCCGSAGSYSLLQPEMSAALRARKLENIALNAPDAVASANIGCLSHLGGPDAPPIVHPAELIDWAEGGPRPAALSSAKRPVATQKTR